MRLTRKPSTRYWPLLCKHHRGSTIPDQHWLWCASGRGGIELACSAANLREGQTVLLPEYICDVVLHPLQRLKLKAAWYSLNTDLTPNWQSLEAQLPGVQAALLMHPFGQPQDAPRFAACCKKAGVLFIEDNAHGYGATLNGQPLGTFGDMGVASPWKQYAVPHGAALWFQNLQIANKAKNLCEHWPVAPVSIAKSWCKSRLRDVLTLVSTLRRIIIPPPAADMDDPDQPQPPCLAHPAVLAVLSGVQPVRDAARRRAIYAEWQTFAAGKELTPVFSSLHPEAAPLCFAAYAADITTRQRWLRWGWQHDIAVHTWPTLPEQLRNRPQAADRWQRLLCFPIHQEMDPSLLRAMLDSLPPPC